jgi:dipeptidyl aminopeptidase/acylaminoacyl peptidase
MADVHLTELTDAITEDWGGKPFVDLIEGWKYALEKYPEVRNSCLC